ncbi:MAG TPA: helix-hairpin-helix domain-containing protein [Acidimicrobiia bacterium]|nr:helix-hairpin-helix domain-containing protein [Acidimicrobiia bacterium]
MRKLGKIIALLGGAIAVLWAMRDRLVSIAAPQEPEPPRFKVVPPVTSSLPEEDDLTSITGIGPVFAGRIRDAGITTFSDVATAGAAKLAEITGASASRASDWVAQASAQA